MAKRKSKNKGKRVQKKQATDLGLVVTIILSILLTVLIYTESGYIGIMLSDFFGGMFGIIKYVVPIGAFAVAIKKACKEDDEYISAKILKYTVLLIFVAVILSVYEICNGEINIEQNISDVVKDAYVLGENNIGGGALGTVAAVPLFKLFGKIGTIILSNIDMKNGTAEVHVKLAVANNRGKGYGTDAVNTIVKYAFNEMRLNCIYAEILEYNQPSIKLFEKCGFKKEGTLCSRIYKGGKYINLMSFSKVKGI